MHLIDLVSQMKNVEYDGLENPGLAGVTADSREVRPGFLFAAVAGVRDDGAKYIDDAVKNGAAAILLADLPRLLPRVPYVVCQDIRKALGEAADAFYDHPSRSLDLVGVTGTNGKTTTAFLLRHVFAAAGIRTGMLGTIEYDLGDKVEPAPLTTPDPVLFTRSLSEMRGFGCRAAAVEVSSHALAQERVWPHRFSGAVFTNLTRDHLDFHGDMETYLEAKRSLFTRLDGKAVAVVNLADPAAPRIMDGCAAKMYGYVVGDGEPTATLPAHFYRATVLESSLSGQVFRLTGDGIDETIRTPLVGVHNIENCVGCILLALGQGMRIHTIQTALADFPGVPGRLERIESGRGVKVFVDYAHTDGALRSVLSVLRPLTKGKLITVFGCGGDRDPGKRPLMAKAAGEFSDVVVVTSDNPRSEDPEKILDAIMPGFPDAGKVVREADRPTAVRRAVAMAGPDDAVLVAGKGHEDYQITAGGKRHMDDRELVREAFAWTIANVPVMERSGQ